MSERITYPKSLNLPKRIALDDSLSGGTGEWLTLIGGGGETSADDIEAFFAEFWPEVEPEAIH